MNGTRNAVRTSRPEERRDLYRSFNGTGRARNSIPAKGFDSCPIALDGGSRPELMPRKSIGKKAAGEYTTYSRMAFGGTGRDEVTAPPERLRADGYRIAGKPGTAGGGYFKRVVEDPDGNRVENVCKRR